MADLTNLNLNSTVYNFRDTVSRAMLQDLKDTIDDYYHVIPDQIVGIQVDYQNCTCTPLELAVGTNVNFNQFPMYGNRKRCNVNNDGTITAFYGDSNYKEDGSNGQVMVYQPKFYYKVVPVRTEAISDGIGYHLRCANYYISSQQYNGFKVHPAFINENGVEVDYYLEGAYEASLYDVSASSYITDDSQVADFTSDRLSSIANVKPMSGLTQNLTRWNIEQLARNRGSGWHNITVQMECADMLLMMIEYGTMNIQNALGLGVTSVPDNSSYNCSALTGSTSSLGNASGRASQSVVTKGSDSTTYTANGYVSVSYRGKENPYGNIWKFVQGLTIYGNGSQKGGQPYICNNFSFTENTTTGYTGVGFYCANSVGYISAMGWGSSSTNWDYDWLFISSENSGNSSVPVGDYNYISINLNGYRMALLGAVWSNGLLAGPSYWYLDAGPSYRYRSVGGRAAYVPLATN